MHASGLHQYDIVPSPAAHAVVAALFVNECALDAPGLSIPRAEPHLVVRFGLKTRQGLDLHVMGTRQHAKRKALNRGQQVVTARLRLGMHETIFGVPPSALAERVVPLDEVWGDAALRLRERLIKARDLHEAATLLEDAIVRRRLAAESQNAHSRLALAAAARLETERVNEVAGALGVSERNLRRVFREAIGMSPKEYARLSRFHRALQAAGTSGHIEWADIAAATGYYDQAHLIAEFREITGVTPRALLSELRSAPPSKLGPSDPGRCLIGFN